MMKVLWLNNFPLPKIAQKENLDSVVNEGWVQGLFDEVSSVVELHILFPQKKQKETLVNELGKGRYYGFYHRGSDPSFYDAPLEKVFESILEKVRPDVIHLMGSEYPFTLAMAKSITKTGLQNRAVLSVQGLASMCARHYFSGIPDWAVKRRTFRDFIKRDGLIRQKKTMETRGEYEKESIRLIPNIIGRTDWDEACTKMLNPDRSYYYNGEILRQTFYSGEQWSFDSAEKHALFMSQATYPVKGFHFALEALYEIGKFYGDVHLYVGGSNIYGAAHWKLSAYPQYINSLIQKYGLRNRITFLGRLQANEMKERYLKAHVFISPSAIENSPNSVGEAMVLGVPVVASDVGGVKNMLVHGKEGFLYPADEPYMLAYYVMKIFEDKPLANRLSQNAGEHGKLTHSRREISRGLIDIYRRIEKA